MALRRYGNKRDEIENDVVGALEAAHCTVYKLDLPLDLLVARIMPDGRRHTMLLEVKAPGVGRLTPAQQEFIKTWKGDYAVVHCPNEALAAVGIT